MLGLQEFPASRGMAYLPVTSVTSVRSAGVTGRRTFTDSLSGPIPDAHGGHVTVRAGGFREACQAGTTRPTSSVLAMQLYLRRMLSSAA